MYRMKLSDLNFTYFLKLLVPIVIGSSAFYLVVGFSPLNPLNSSYLNGEDPLMNYFGWVFFRQSPWSFPVGLNPNYGLSISSSIAFSDSIPFFAFIFKLLTKILPENFQYLGLWILLCFVLQALIARQLIALFTSNFYIQILGLPLFLFYPPLISRIGLHAALLGQFLVLMAIYLYILSNSEISKKFKYSFVLWYGLLIASMMVHFYLLVMVWGLWLAYLLDHFIAKKISFKYLVIEMLLGHFLLIIVAWQCGYFIVGTASTSIVGYGGYGAYGLNIMEPFFSNYWSYFYTHAFNFRSISDGFNYLGLGIILTIIFALPAYCMQNKWLEKCIRKSLFLASALILFVVLAISNHIAFGSYLFIFNLPKEILSFLGVIRAADRLIWPVLYCLLIFSIVVMIRSYKKWVVILILFLTSSIQIFDTSIGWKKLSQFPLRMNSEKIDEKLKHPFWENASQHYKFVTLNPAQNQASDWQIFSAYAARHKMATNSVYLARMDQAKLLLSQEQFLKVIISGNYVQNTLYIFKNWRDSLNLPAVSFSPQKDLFARIDGFNVLAPGWKTCATCKHVEASTEINSLIPITKIGIIYKFSDAGQENIALLNGWAYPESWGTWSIGDNAKIAFPLPKSPTKIIELNLRALITMQHPNTQIKIYIDGVFQNTIILFQSQNNIVQIPIPKSIPHKDYLVMEFRFLNPVRPSEIGFINGDNRLLGIGLISAQFR